MSERDETSWQGGEVPEAVSACDDHRRVHPHTLAKSGDRYADRRNRMLALVLLLLCVFPLAMGLYLSPERGLSQEFGVPACGFKEQTGLPCLTCGMTTSFTHAVRGDLLTAFELQPFGGFLSVVAAAMSFVFGWALFTGMSLDPIGRAIWRPKVMIPVLVFLVVSWLYNVMMTQMGLHV